MSQAAILWLYFVVVFGIVALPGLDMAFVMASAMLGGRRSGLAAVAGIVAGGVCHLAMGALGAAVILRLWPALFDLMLAGGALYIAWMGVAFLRSSSVFRPDSAGAPVCAAATTFRRAMVTSLVNPKAYIFMLAIFPQFLKPALGPVWIQAGLLGAITSLTQLGVYGALALAAGRASGWFAANPGASGATAKTMGVLLLAVAALTAAQLFHGATDVITP
ncbi:MAG TPA: LysE family translocator [Telluria sp.]|nr:LysE family translocator [Telluria sp.]